MASGLALILLAITFTPMGLPLVHYWDRGPRIPLLGAAITWIIRPWPTRAEPFSPPSWAQKTGWTLLGLTLVSLAVGLAFISMHGMDEIHRMSAAELDHYSDRALLIGKPMLFLAPVYLLFIGFIRLLPHWYHQESND